MAMQENAPTGRETVEDIKQKVDLMDVDEKYGKKKAEQVKEARARNLIEAREGLKEAAPGIDMAALDRCVGRDYIKQIDALSTLKGNLLGAQATFGDLSPKGLAAINRYLKQGMLDAVVSRVHDLAQGLGYNMEQSQMSLSLREKVTPLALDFNAVKIMKLAYPEGSYRVIVTDPNEVRILNEVYEPSVR